MRPSLVLAACLALGAAAWTGPRLASGAHALTSRELSLPGLMVKPTPFRDLYLLADQLRLRPPRTIPHVVNRTSPNYAVGHVDHFNVLGEDQNRYFHIAATLRAKTPHFYIYVQNGVHVSNAQVQAAANAFETRIYPTDRSYYGSEWRPGVDNDPHITCLYANLHTTGAIGYYSAEDEYPRLVDPWSNQREMFYMNTQYTKPGSRDFLDTLSHEFQHMIHWHLHPHDNAWLNEGMSVLAERLNGYGNLDPSYFASQYASQPDTQLNSWSLVARNQAHYGAGYLFMSYLYDHFGRSFIHDMLADGRYTDFALVDDVLKKHHSSLTSRDVFTRWVIANYLNDASIANGIYSDKALSGTAHVTKSTAAPFNFDSSVPPYAAQYVAVNSWPSGKTFRLQFSAPTTVPAVGVSDNGPFWWGNRGDMSDTRLTRTVDLRRVRQATLHFRAWYDIEKDYDFAYVEVSRDGGKTWTTLRGSGTTHKNPTGASYGYGYTGNSKGWRNETVSLSRYAGQVIKLRFQYITDDEYTGQGMVIKNISIPQIGFHDAFSGWDEQGFVPVLHNSLPAQWTVQLIATTSHGTTVSQLPVSSAGAGSVTIDPSAQGLKKLVVAVFTTAPKTTVDSSYNLTATVNG